MGSALQIPMRYMPIFQHCIIKKRPEIKMLDFIIVGDMDMNKKKSSYWSMFEEADGGEYSLGKAF